MKVIRNALSHPTVQADAGCPTTGYSTVLNDSGLIENFRFVVSPWVKSAEKQKGHGQKECAAAMTKAQALLEADQRSKLGWRERSGSYFLELEGQPFVPHTIVTLSVLQLRTLTLELSDLLGADPGSQAAGLKGREAPPADALFESTINHGAPNGRS